MRQATACDDPDWCGGTDLDRNGTVDAVDFEIWLAILEGSVAPGY